MMRYSLRQFSLRDLIIGCALMLLAMGVYASNGGATALRAKHHTTSLPLVANR